MITIISQRVIINKNLGDLESLEKKYIKYFSQKGFLLIPLPNNATNFKRYLSELNIKRVILTGGGDIQCYSKNYSKARYTTEVKLLEYCISNRIPVLGICRGSQIINKYFGGSLTQSIISKSHINKTHSINLIDKKIINILNGRSIHNVNSYHKYVISADGLSNHLVPFAVSSDLTIEGFTHKDLPIVGIMWHPERNMLNSSISEILIEDFHTPFHLFK